jgi:hypothetical protein
MKPANRRAQEDITAFNQAVDNYNLSVNVFNKTSGELNDSREKVVNNWETTRKKFMDLHVPYKL